MRHRVLVMDADERQALAACRALGRAGYEVGVTGSRERSLAGHSRYAARHHQLPDARARTPLYEARLGEIVRQHGYDVLLPGLDETFARVERVELAARLAPAPGEARDRIVDKLRLAELAAAADVPYPRTVSATDGAFEQLTLPVVVKARLSAVSYGEYVAHHSGAHVAETWVSARSEAGKLSSRGLEAIVQERIERAEKINVTILRRGGRSEVRFPYRVLRDLPLTGGVAVATETLSAHDGAGREAVAALEQLCDTAGYEGVANGEFARSRHDGRLYLIEINARLWGSLHFAERLGQRVTERQVRAVLGLDPLAPADPPPARRYHFLTSEVRWVLRHPRRRRALFEVMLSLGPRDTYEYLDERDLGVLVRYGAEKVRRRRSAAAAGGWTT
jgi:biotin carboxylase